MPNIMYNLFKSLARYICSKRPNQISEKIVWIVGRVLQELSNVNFDIQTNGELRILKCFGQTSPKCIIDVGANVGDWALIARSHCPDSTIHSLEILPQNYHSLHENTKGDEKIFTHNIGLSDLAGELKIFSSSKSKLNDMATASKITEMQSHGDFYDIETICKVDVGSAFLDQQSISQVDMLKIDTEGHDLQVLKGFGDRLSAVRLVQFEYGVFNIGSRALLADFFSFFKEYGFIVGKVYPNHVDFFDYHFSAEDFAGNNYVAVRKDDTELLNLINGKIR